MDDLRKACYRVALLLIMIFKLSECYKVPLKTRQNNLCSNHVMGEFVANPEHCHLFYWCGENGEAVSAACPPNMLFNAQTKLCDTKANVQCRQISQTTQRPDTTSNLVGSSVFATIQQYCVNAFEQQPNSDSLIFLAHPSKCNQYYMCYYGQALLQECSRDLQWNSRIGKCDFPANTNCENQVGVTNTFPIAPATEISSSLDEINGIMCPIYGRHIFPHMQNCNKFIYCVKGHYILQQCPFYKYFDVESGRCITRKKALCIKDIKMEYKRNTF